MFTARKYNKAKREESALCMAVSGGGQEIVNDMVEPTSIVHHKALYLLPLEGKAAYQLVGVKPGKPHSSGWVFEMDAAAIEMLAAKFCG